MAAPIISYTGSLPEVPNRQPYLPPTLYLRKKPGSHDEYEIVEGRRPSKLLLVNKLRAAVDAWRSSDYEGASSVTRRLFTYWFDEDHLVDEALFRYYFGQREAVETMVYLLEVAGVRDTKALIDTYAEVFKSSLFGDSITYQTTMDGKRQLRRFFPEFDPPREGVQDLPPDGLARYACKMATGSGKTAVMAMLMVWCYFHKKMVPGSLLSTNFLLLAPNVIVYERLGKDFGSGRIFEQMPLLPPEWKHKWNLKVILRGESAEPDPSGTLFLTNIHQIYESRDKEWTPANAVEAILGKPVQGAALRERTMLERLKSLPDLIAINDEAHHVHEEALAWAKTLMTIHQALPRGLALWLDFSATPKDQNGAYYPWCVCDYPLAQAVEDRIVKAPLIVHKVERDDPEKVTRDNVIAAYGDWLEAALARYREHERTYKPLGAQPVLFIMAEQNNLADEIGNWLKKTKELGFKQDEILVIHTDNTGEVQKGEVEKLRQIARDIDLPTSKVKVIVSVMMLREGWDVRNVTVVLGLRPFTSKAQILPEQAVGRGLRPIQGISPDRTQTLEVMGTTAFEAFVRRLEAEGVSVPTTTASPVPPVIIQPVQEKLGYDISIPKTSMSLSRNYRKLDSFNPLSLDPLYDGSELDKLRISLEMEFATTETRVHQVDLSVGIVPIAEQLLSTIVRKVMERARLTGVFTQLYPKIRTYIVERCFARHVDLENTVVRRYLNQLKVQERIAGHLGQTIGQLTCESLPISIQPASIKLSHTKPFTWRRKHVICDHTIFNYVATYNDFESRFAAFLDRCPDVLRFAAFGTTEQDTAVQFHVDYLKKSGAIAFYYPDWVLVQKSERGPINWIVETKGRVWEGTEAKDAAIKVWCEAVSEQTNTVWRFIRVNQSVFDKNHYATFSALLVDEDPSQHLWPDVTSSDEKAST
jgi:type III restriction enzyme